MLYLLNAIIDKYSRKQAIEDGVLIDVTKYAKEAGINSSVCVTNKVWSYIKEIPDEAKHQDIVGRLWDILNVFRLVAKECNSSFVKFTIEMKHYITIAEEGKQDKKIVENLISLCAIAGPGDDYELVITIMLPGED